MKTLWESFFKKMNMTQNEFNKLDYKTRYLLWENFLNENE